MEEEKYFEVVVPPNQRKERLDKFLTQRLKSISRARLQKLISEGQVLVEGSPAKASHQISPAEKIEITIPKPKKPDILPEAIPLDIVHEDADLIVLNKRAGMVVHPAFAHYTGTLVNALLHHCGNLSSIGGRQRPGIVHRLDKETSGLMVVAKNDFTHQHLSRQFAEKSTEREYRAVAWGRFKRRSGRIETHLARSPKDRTRITVQPTGKEAVTNYRVLETHWLHSYVSLKLETGRTHQIRVHLSFIGHPVFGDASYGGRNRPIGGLSNKERAFATELLKTMDRQALHAISLGFVHPRKNQFVRFESDLPDDMKLLLERIRTEKL